MIELMPTPEEGSGLQQKYFSMLLEAQEQAIEKIALGKDIYQVLDVICVQIEKILAGDSGTSSILILRNGHLYHGAAPTLPPGYCQAVDGVAIGPKVGSCGTASFTGEQTIVSDIEHDPLWEDFAGLALDYGLRACWSTPIKSSTGQVLGSFAIYYPKVKRPQEWHLALIQRFVHLAGFAIEKYRTGQEIRQLHGELEGLFNAMPSVLIGLDESLCIRHWNRAAERRFDCRSEQTIGQHLLKVFPDLESEIEKIRQSVDKNEVYEAQRRPLVRRGHQTYESITVYPVELEDGRRIVIRLDDVTNQVRLEALMIENEKMLSVGGLAAGMAHEINNPLAGLMQTANVVKRRLLDVELEGNRQAAGESGMDISQLTSYVKSREIDRMLEDMDASGKRIVRIVDNMLNFARKGNVEKTAVDMADLIEKSLALAATDYNVERQAGFGDITVKRDYSKGLEPVNCESGQIQQVLLNLLQNAAYALFEAKIADPEICVRLYQEPAKQVQVVEISDNGPGIGHSEAARIFEPFYTTKPVGNGTGLGLSVSYFIINELHGGDIRVESVPAGGARFIVSLPVGNSAP